MTEPVDFVALQQQARDREEERRRAEGFVPVKKPDGRIVWIKKTE